MPIEGEGGGLWPTKNVIKYRRKGGISCKVIINVGACDGELPPQTFGNTRISHIPFTVRSSTLTLGKGCSIPGRSSILISHWHRFSLRQKNRISIVHHPPLIERFRFVSRFGAMKFHGENSRDEEDLDRIIDNRISTIVSDKARGWWQGDEREKSKDRLWRVGGSRFILGGDFHGFSARIICSTSGRRKKETEGEGGWSVSLHWEEYQLLEIQKGKRA